MAGIQTGEWGKRGVVVVNTGEGKGKTTAALGAMFRAWGRGFKVCMIQFLKHERGKWGEVKAAEALDGFDLIATGDGFTWTSKDDEATKALALQGWTKAKAIIAGDSYELVVLDEFTYPLDFGWIDPGSAVEWLQSNKPARQHLIITGRTAPAELITYADIVTDLTKIKHAFDRGRPAQAGVEF